jgi:hypothetical protein
LACEGGFEQCFAFMQSVGNSYIKAYRPIVEKRKDSEYGERERQFQLYHRGRYVVMQNTRIGGNYLNGIAYLNFLNHLPQSNDGHGAEQSLNRDD